MYQKSVVSYFVSLSVRSIGGSRCRLDLRFSSAGYNGIVQLQDALLTRKMLHDMPVKTHFITSSDGKIFFFFFASNFTLSFKLYSRDADKFSKLKKKNQFCDILNIRGGNSLAHCKKGPG